MCGAALCPTPAQHTTVPRPPHHHHPAHKHTRTHARTHTPLQVMGGVEGTLDKQRVNLTLEVEGGMWMRAVPRTH